MDTYLTGVCKIETDRASSLYVANSVMIGVISDNAMHVAVDIAGHIYLGEQTKTGGVILKCKQTGERGWVIHNTNGNDMFNFTVFDTDNIYLTFQTFVSGESETFYNGN